MIARKIKKTTFACNEMKFLFAKVCFSQSLFLFYLYFSYVLIELSEHVCGNVIKTVVKEVESINEFLVRHI